MRPLASSYGRNIPSFVTLPCQPNTTCTSPINSYVHSALPQYPRGAAAPHQLLGVHYPGRDVCLLKITSFEKLPPLHVAANQLSDRPFLVSWLYSVLH